VVSCAQLAAVPALGRCPAGATAAVFPADGFAGPLYGVDATVITWPAANVRATRLDSLAVDAIDVATNGTVPAVEQARTVLENAHAYPAYLADGAPSTVGELITQSNPTNSGYQQLANTVILVSLPIAGCTLAAGIAAGLADRKRPFSMLRLTGARLAMLRRAGKRRPAASRRRRRDGHRVRRHRDVRLPGDAAPDGRARRRLLPHHRRRDPGGPRHHHGHLPAAGTHHRTRGRQKRMNPRI
jgi:hypothetical protein